MTIRYLAQPEIALRHPQGFDSRFEYHRLSAFWKAVASTQPTNQRAKEHISAEIKQSEQPTIVSSAFRFSPCPEYRFTARSFVFLMNPTRLVADTDIKNGPS
jgi:hypothetical protein